MHRTRHESLDFLGSGGASELPPHEEWAAFLSTSMTALATTDDEPETESPNRQRHAASADASPFGKALAVDTFDGSQRGAFGGGDDDTVPGFLGGTGAASGARKPRGGSMSESLTSSTGSSPSGVAWRPLGRRLTAPHIQPPVASSASSSSLSSTTSIENQLEQPLETGAAPPTFMRLASSPALSSGSHRQLHHAASLRDVVTSCLSSSGSSFYDSSSSSDEETSAQGNAGKQTGAAGEIPTSGGSIRPGIIDVDPSYAESCLPVLSALPGSKMSASEGGTLSRSNSLAHVKSPVLSSRKDSATWQLQDEEFITSPRFGSLRGSNQLDSPPPPPAMGMFSRTSGSFMQDESSNQFEDDFRSGSSRAAKDMRASSVDFTFSRPQFDVNPPLPPPQEPMQRLRARSFSYSATYGSGGFQPPPNAYGKQYAPLPNQPPQMHPAMPQDFPPTLRGFHNARGPPPSAGNQHMAQHMSPVQPPPSGIRPPRVSIPADSPMHQYHQFGPPMLYRRYSTDTFVAPPYRDTFPNEREPPNRQGLNGRGMRSYSVEYGNFGSRPVRSQSMEGEQLFAEEQPNMGYPPLLSRSNSAGVSFDWSRSRMDNAPSPPLPPDVRPSPASTGHYATSPRPEAYYDVEFKRGRQEVFAGRAIYNPGEYVKVEADRGEDIGRIVQRTTDLTKIHGDVSDEVAARPKRHDLPTKKIIGVASQRECEMLSEQRKEEQDVFEVCKSKVRQRLLPMNVIDAEYQFDRHKLTFFFEADRRIDFRELVRDLFAIYKTRIWLQQVVPTGKKTSGDSDGN